MWPISRRIVEIPLTISPGKIVGKVQIDKNGRLRVKMKKWAKPADFGYIISFLHKLNSDMNNHNYTTQIDAPARWRRGLI